jgi:hypothetical protein
MQSRRWWRFLDIKKFVPIGFPICFQTIQKNSWELLFHPSYSLDLTPSDYHLFKPLKDHLRGHHHDTDEAVSHMKLEQISTTDAFLRFCNAGRNAQIEM